MVDDGGWKSDRKTESQHSLIVDQGDRAVGKHFLPIHPLKPVHINSAAVMTNCIGLTHLPPKSPNSGGL